MEQLNKRCDSINVDHVCTRRENCHWGQKKTTCSGMLKSTFQDLGRQCVEITEQHLCSPFRKDCQWNENTGKCENYDCFVWGCFYGSNPTLSPSDAPNSSPPSISPTALTITTSGPAGSPSDVSMNQEYAGVTDCNTFV